MYRQDGIEPDIISWSVLVKGHAHAGNFTGAFDVIERMLEEVRKGTAPWGGR
jgi:pentatricopeptide repeat protein